MPTIAALNHRLDFLRQVIQRKESYRRCFATFQDARLAYAEQREQIEAKTTMQNSGGNEHKSAHRVSNIIYNEAYGVPTLWFNFYTPDGVVMQLEEFSAFLDTDATSTNILNGLSQAEHPIHGIAFYNIHPCQTASLMSEFTTRNYLIRCVL